MYCGVLRRQAKRRAARPYSSERLEQLKCGEAGAARRCERCTGLSEQSVS